MRDRSPAFSLEEFLYCTALHGNQLRLNFFSILYAYFCLDNSIHRVSQVYILLKAIPTEGSTPNELLHCNLLAFPERARHRVFLYSLWDINKSWGHRLQNHLIKACKQSKEHRVHNTLLWMLCFLNNSSNCRKFAESKLRKIISY